MNDTDFESEPLPEGQLPERRGPQRVIGAEPPKPNDPPKDFWAWELKGWAHCHTHFHDHDAMQFAVVILRKEKR